MEKVVNIIVIVDRRYILLTRIREGDFWTLPGGRAEKGESLKVALRRETDEELPNVTILELIPYKKFKGITSGHGNKSIYESDYETLLNKEIVKSFAENLNGEITLHEVIDNEFAKLLGTSNNSSAIFLPQHYKHMFVAWCNTSFRQDL
jgi:methyltransferase-like protein